MGRGSSKASRGGAKDITGQWSGVGNYSNAMEELRDVVKRQGFDGKPTELSGRDFDKAASRSGYIFARRVNASTQAQLDQYSNKLRNGDFFLGDRGGSVLGKGMYASGGKGTKVTDAMIAGTGGAHGASKVEVMTLAPSAKVITRSKLQAMYSGDPMQNMTMSQVKSTSKAKMSRLKKQYQQSAGNKKFGAMNSFAAAKGYSAIDSENGTMVILDRSRLILKK